MGPFNGPGFEPRASCRRKAAHVRGPGACVEAAGAAKQGEMARADHGSNMGRLLRVFNTY
jgi:hypothetical protein